MGWSPANLEQYRMMKDAGMNAVMPRFELDVTTTYDPAKFATDLSERDAGIKKEILDSSAMAKRLGLRYFHCLGVACESQTYIEGMRDNPARFNDGRLPSPLDTVYWKRVILDRVDRALRLLGDREQYALDAIIIDPEMYALNDALWGEPDFGKYAFETYIKEKAKEVPAGVDNVGARQEWIKANGLGDDYVNWQFQRIKGLARGMRELIDRSRPELVVGYIIYENRLWFNAMAAGLSTEKIPVFVGPESTYSGVMDESMIKLLEGMKKSIGVPCLLTPGADMGLVKGKVPYERLKALEGNIYQRCQYGAGYWIFAIYNFGTTNEEQKAFFESLKVVNDALDNQALSGVVSNDLKAQPIPVELPGNFHSLLADASLMKPMPPNVARPKFPYVEPKLRGTYTQLLWPKKGQRSSVTVRSIQLNPNYLDRAEARLFDQKGNQIYDGPTSLNESRTIWLPDVVDGLCAQVLSGGQNGFGLSGIDCPSMIYADDMLIVNSRDFTAGRFFFYVPDGRKDFGLKLIGHPGMPGDYKLYDPAGKKVREWKTLKENKEEKIEVLTPGIWCMEIQNLVNDGGFKLTDLPNFFALNPDQLMIPNNL